MSCIGTMSRDFSPRSFIKRAILNILYGWEQFINLS
jgi:hypothetical protein